MTSNVYTKNEILQNLASKGFFIDIFTLDTFLDKWKLEAIFEDEQGCEFYDVSVIDMIMNGLFNTSGQSQDTSFDEQEPRILSSPKLNNTQQPQMQQNMQFAQPQMQPQMQQIQPNMQMQNMYQQPQMYQNMQQGWQQNMPYPQMQYQQPQMQQNMQFAQPQMQPQMQQIQPNAQMQNINQSQVPQAPKQQTADFKITDPEVASVLNNISLSDGTSLSKGIQKTSSGQEFNIEAPLKIEAPKLDLDINSDEDNKPKKVGILEGAMENVGETYLKDEPIVAQMKDDTLKQLEAMGLITLDDFDKEKFESIGKKKYREDESSESQQEKKEDEAIEIKDVEPMQIEEAPEISIQEEVSENPVIEQAVQTPNEPQVQQLPPQVQQNEPQMQQNMQFAQPQMQQFDNMQPQMQQFDNMQPQMQQFNQPNMMQPQEQALMYQNDNFSADVNPAQMQENISAFDTQNIIPPGDEGPDFDDMSLLSESYEAQEKFREYIVSELSKKNVDLTPKSNEFKLDISERTLSMIARSMAKKIAKHVNNICTQGTNNQAQFAEIEEKNKLLEQKTTKLEEENKKLRILLTETNKNLNETNKNLECYKPTIFGLYKKVTPKKKK